MLQPLYDSADYVTMAYNMARYNTASVSTVDSLAVKPDSFREPAPSFVLSLPIRGMDLGQHSLSCILSDTTTCHDVLKRLANTNILIVALLIPAVFLITYWLTRSSRWALLGTAILATSSILPS